MKHGIAGSAAFACAVLAASQPALAVLNTETIDQNAAEACRLSNPTPGTMASAGATGFLNAGTTGVYVICGATQPTDDNAFYALALRMASSATNEITINCTFVSGFVNNGQSAIYLTKSLLLPADGQPRNLGVLPADYGEGATTIPYGYNVSVTCMLPPKVAILRTSNQFAFDIGN
jgi:hypothetical protein